MKKKKNRRFEVYLDLKFPGEDPITEIVEMPFDATDAECETACEECFDSLIDNCTYGGWDEIEEDYNNEKEI